MIHTAEMLDCTIRSKGCFALVNLEGNRILVYKPASRPGDMITQKIAARLSENNNEGMAKLRNFLINQARLGK